MLLCILTLYFNPFLNLVLYLSRSKQTWIFQEFLFSLCHRSGFLDVCMQQRDSVWGPHSFLLKCNHVWEPASGPRRTRACSQLFAFPAVSSTHPASWREEGGGFWSWGLWSEMERFIVLGRKLVREKKAAENVCVWVCVQSDCLLFLLLETLQDSEIISNTQNSFCFFLMFYVHRTIEENEVAPLPSICACTPNRNTPMCPSYIDRPASQTQSHKGWPRFQHMYTQAGCKEKHRAQTHTHAYMCVHAHTHTLMHNK